MRTSTCILTHAQALSQCRRARDHSSEQFTACSKSSQSQTVRLQTGPGGIRLLVDTLFICITATYGWIVVGLMDIVTE